MCWTGLRSGILESQFSRSKLGKPFLPGITLKQEKAFSKTPGFVSTHFWPHSVAFCHFKPSLADHFSSLKSLIKMPASVRVCCMHACVYTLCECVCFRQDPTRTRRPSAAKYPARGSLHVVSMETRRVFTVNTVAIHPRNTSGKSGLV